MYSRQGKWKGQMEQVGEGGGEEVQFGNMYGSLGEKEEGGKKKSCVRDHDKYGLVAAPP